MCVNDLRLRALAPSVDAGRTTGIEVSVSIPDAVFAKAESKARRLGTTRSELYAKALDAFVEDPTPDQITEAINAVIDAVGDGPDAFVRASVNRVLRRVEW